jgi:hypothetical protein
MPCTPAPCMRALCMSEQRSAYVTCRTQGARPNAWHGACSRGACAGCIKHMHLCLFSQFVAMAPHAPARSRPSRGTRTRSSAWLGAPTARCCRRAGATRASGSGSRSPAMSTSAWMSSRGIPRWGRPGGPARCAAMLAGPTGFGPAKRCCRALRALIHGPSNTVCCYPPGTPLGTCFTCDTDMRLVHMHDTLWRFSGFGLHSPPTAVCLAVVLSQSVEHLQDVNQVSRDLLGIPYTVMLSLVRSHIVLTPQDVKCKCVAWHPLGEVLASASHPLLRIMHDCYLLS